MKVFVIHAALQGSTGNIINSISTLLKKNGDVVFMGMPPTTWNRSVLKRDCIYIGNRYTVKFGRLLSFAFNGEKIANYLSTLLFLRKLKKINPDVIHIHNLHSSYINLPLLFRYLRRSRKPTVWTLHDCWPLTGHCAHYIYIGCNKWKEKCFDCKLYREYPATLFDNSSYMHGLKKEIFSNVPNLQLVAVSPWLKEQVEMSFLRTYTTHVINNGIDTKVFFPRPDAYIRKKYGLEGKFVIMGVSTAWSNKKGLSDFIKLSTQITDDDIIVIVGLDDKENMDLPSNVISISRTYSKDELAELYSMANVLLSLSLAETFGLTIIEGMACGTPAVVYDNTAQKDLITANTGFKVKTGDVVAVNRAIRNIKSKGKSYYTSQCRKHAVTNYSEENMCACYYNLLKDSANLK